MDEPLPADPGAYLLLIDLANSDGDLQQLIPIMRESNPRLRVIAYGPHVDEPLLEAARQAFRGACLTTRRHLQQPHLGVETPLESGPRTIGSNDEGVAALASGVALEIRNSSPPEAVGDHVFEDPETMKRR